MSVIPKTARIAISGIFVFLTIIVRAFVTVILQRVDTDRLPKHSIHVQIYRRRDPSSEWRIRNAGSEVDGRETLAGNIRPGYRLASVGELDKSMTRGLQLRTGIRRGGCRTE